MAPRSIDKPKIVVVQGPTGVGKTAVVMDLAEHLPVEIINADSMQCYRHMDIGTAKPSPDEQKRVPHHLFSIVNPDEQYTAARFMEQGRAVIGEILSRGNIPLVVGGTGFYIKALTRGLFDAPEGDAALREQLRKENRKDLYARLQEADPFSAQRINPNDLVRIIRALEIWYLTGEPLSRHQQRHKFQDDPYSCLKICFNRDRKNLYKRIELRVERMMERGLEHEVRRLIAMGYSPGLRSMQSIGYRQMADYVQGGVSMGETVAQIQKETKRYAKRQLTWFRHDPDIIRVMLPGHYAEIEPLVKNFLNIK